MRQVGYLQRLYRDARSTEHNNRRNKFESTFPEVTLGPERQNEETVT